MDPITTTIAAGHHAATLFKSIAETLKASGKSERLSDLIDLQVEMLDILAKHQDLLIENGSLRVTIKELEKSLNLGGEMIRERNRLFLKSDTNKERPYCMACWGHDHQLIDLIVGIISGQEFIVCNICKARSRPSD